MLTNFLMSRAVARGATLALAISMIALAGISMWGSINNERSVSELRSLNSISDAWGDVFLAINTEGDALHTFQQTQDEGSQQRLVSAVGKASIYLTWLEENGDERTVTAAKQVSQTYNSYTLLLTNLLNNLSAEPDSINAQLEQAELGVASARKVVAANLGNLRIETAALLDKEKASNKTLQANSIVIFLIGLALLLLSSLILLLHQRRVERQADEAKHNLGELQEAYQREQAANAERDALEVELRHAQKLEAVGRLASGIAHEINTPVQFVGDNLTFLRQSFEGTDRLLKFYKTALENNYPVQLDELRRQASEIENEVDLEFLLEEIPAAFSQSLEGVKRVSQIVTSMKRFGHPDQKLMESIDLNQAINDTVVIASSQIKGVADVELKFGEIPPVHCFPGDLNQVWLNLLINAAHAIESTNERGTITIETSPADGQVTIRISDTGTGIPKEVAGRIFDPFFTTKELGKGTGQGLSLCRSIIVDRHHGSITFETTPGEGTTFIIQLPTASQ